MERWFTADPHFWHPAMLTLLERKRPYKSVEDMNEDLIRRWNDVVKRNDIVYVLGDFAVKMPEGGAEKIFRQLNGDKFLIIGNHDQKNPSVVKLPWKWVGERKTLSFDGVHIALDHFPMQAWDGSMKGSWHLYGHVHGDLPEHPSCLKMDVGVDVMLYGEPLFRPISFGEIKEVLSKRIFVPPDKRRVYYEEDLKS
jgi:calcineurin-like phosphoesterase family protein